MKIAVLGGLGLQGRAAIADLIGSAGVAEVICVDTLASVIACAAAGADRIELCAGLVEGGTTPSLGFLRAARRSFPGRIMAMVRPRAGDFYYGDDEFAQMLDEIELFRREGADGIVFGMLEPDGRIDTIRSREVVARVRAPVQRQ